MARRHFEVAQTREHSADVTPKLRILGKTRLEVTSSSRDLKKTPCLARVRKLNNTGEISARGHLTQDNSARGHLKTTWLKKIRLDITSRSRQLKRGYSKKLFEETVPAPLNPESLGSAPPRTEARFPRAHGYVCYCEPEYIHPGLEAEQS